MDTKEIANYVLILRNKGYVSDYGDTDYFYGAEEADLNRAYELLDELQALGEVAYTAKYLAEEPFNI